MNRAEAILREELHWLERARHNAVRELTNVQVPSGMAQMLLDRVEFEILEIEAALETLTWRAPVVELRPQLELFA